MAMEEDLTGTGSMSVPRSSTPADKKELTDHTKLTKISGWSEPKAKIARNQAIATHEDLEKRAQAARENPDEAVQQYDAARKSMLGEFSSQPISVYVPCLANAKAASRKERLDLINRATNCGDHCKETAKRLREDMDEIENMRCAKHVYLANDKSAPAELRDQVPPGFLKPTDAELKEMGLTQDMLTPKGTNFRAGAYVKDPKVWAPPDPPDPKTVIAFRGSTKEMEDWENNMMQGANKTPGYIGDDGTINKPYHQRAVEIGQAIEQAKPSPSVRFVGHSLGGGLASAAQGGSGGKEASTYNAAGLHNKTVENYAGQGMSTDPAKIKAIRVKGEVLTRTQETGWKKHIVPSAVGEKHDLEPAHDKASYLASQGRFDKAAAEKNKKEFNEDEEYSGYLHGMDVVIDSLEARKEADQKTLRRCI